MKIRFLALSISGVFLVNSVMAEEVKFEGQAFLEKQLMMAEQTKDKQSSVIGQSATGESQVTTIDENGRLKTQDTAPANNAASQPLNGVPQPGDQNSVPLNGAPQPGDQNSAPLNGALQPGDQNSAPLNGAPQPGDQNSVPLNGAPQPGDQNAVPLNGAPQPGNQPAGAPPVNNQGMPLNGAPQPGNPDMH